MYIPRKREREREREREGERDAGGGGVFFTIHYVLLQQKISEEMKEYRKLYPPQPMFVEWRRGDINIELSNFSEENEEKISEKVFYVFQS